MAFSHDEEQVRAERARAIGLFRYSLICEAGRRRGCRPGSGAGWSGRSPRGEHEGPFGQPVRVSRATIDRWIRDWRRGGFDALVPDPAEVSPRTPADVLDLAVALKREVPGADRGAGRGDPARPLPGGHRTSGPCNATSCAWS